MQPMIAEPDAARVLANRRRKHLINMILLTVWTFAVGTVSWLGGAAKERIFYLEATNAALLQLREQDQRTYGIIEDAKMKTVAVCDALGGKNCEETSK
jgi:nitrate reductase NapE component